MRHGTKERSGGFTLVELLLVVIIIGILATFVLISAMDGVRRAEERATQALIIKLDTGMADRIEALLSTTPDVAAGHRVLALIPNPNLPNVPLPGSEDRAQVIARIDQFKYELPDTFYVQYDPANITNAPNYPNIYPLNFAGQVYPLGASNPTLQNYLVPLGAANSLAARGIFGASYQAAAGIYKNLGYLPPGFDGRDNDGDGLIDEWDEGVDASNYNTVVQHLLAQWNNQGSGVVIPDATVATTARSEMLYALLVEGQGPLGSTMNRDDFTEKEVQDTDGDGLPEFVDAWGVPVQFYRWPTHFPDRFHPEKSDFQKGSGTYNGFGEPRQLFGLDPNQQLVAPAWWSDLTTNNGQMSQNCNAFQYYFLSLLDPNAGSVSSGSGQLWDRSDFYQRRSFFAKFLIVSSGLDKSPGFAQLGRDYRPLLDIADGSGGPVPVNATNLILVENEAGAYDPVHNPGSSPWGLPLYQYPRANQTTTYLQTVGADDITNHNVLAAGGGVR